MAKKIEKIKKLNKKKCKECSCRDDCKKDLKQNRHILYYQGNCINLKTIEDVKNFINDVKNEQEFEGDDKNG